MLILRIAGNIGIAAYGVVANISLVAMAILNGLAQGAQPLISQSYGKGEHDLVRKFLNWSLAAALLIELVIVVLIYGFTDTFISIFNSEHNLQLLAYAHTGLRLYFHGLFSRRYQYCAGCLFFRNRPGTSCRPWFCYARHYRNCFLCNPVLTDSGAEWNLAFLLRIRNHHIFCDSDFPEILIL